MASEIMRLLYFLLRAGYIWGQPQISQVITHCVTKWPETILNPLPQRFHQRHEKNGTIHILKLCFENQFASFVKNTDGLTVQKLHIHLIESISNRKKMHSADGAWLHVAHSYPGMAQCQTSNCSTCSAKQGNEAVLSCIWKLNFIFLTTGIMCMFTFI